MIIVPSISIKPHGIAIYDQYFETRPRREDDFPKPYRWRRPRQNDPEGIVSPKAAPSAIPIRSLNPACSTSSSPNSANKTA